MNGRSEQDLHSFVECVQHIYPEFSVNMAQWLDHGQNNDIIVLNDSWVFRFPHHALSAVNLQNEVAVLGHLKGRLPLEIPLPEYVWIEPNNPCRSFMGYRMIPGVPITSEWSSTVDHVILDVVAKALDDFLQQLHRLSIFKDIMNLIQSSSLFAYWSDMFERIQRLLFPHMRHEARSHVYEHFVSFLQQSNDENFESVLIHGDFGSKNILLDESKNKVVAVIDFGSVTVGDPALDYASASTVYPKMIETMMQHNPIIKKYIER